MKKNILVICFLFMTVFCFAQTSFSIKGRVHNKDGEPISEATIKIEGTNYTAITGVDGNYSFNSIPKGKYRLLISSLEIQSKALALDVNTDYPHLNILIKPQGDLELDEVHVVRKTTKKQIETSGFAVAVIETKEAALRNVTVNELLDRAVGVRVRQNGGVGAAIEYNLNGMSGSTVGIFLDGIPISTFGTSFNLNTIPPSMIERIEVYKGVLPAHLTGDYVGGAINVIMKKNAVSDLVTASISYGSFNTFQGDLGIFYNDKKSGFTARVSGFTTYSDNTYEMWGKFAVLTDEFLKLNRYQRFKRFNNTYKSIGGRFEFGFTDVTWADQFFLGYTVSDNYQDIPHGTTMAQPYVGRFQKFNANIFSLNYVKSNLLLDGLSLHVNAVYSNRSAYLQDTARAMYNWDGKPLMFIFQGEPRARIKPLGQGQQGPATILNVDRTIINTRTNLSYIVTNGHKLSLNHNLNRTKRVDQDLLNHDNLSNANIERNTMTNIIGFNYEAQTFANKLMTNVLAKYTINQSMYTNGGIRNTITNSKPGYGLTASYNVIPKLFLIGSTENSYISPQDEQIYGNPVTNILENLDLLPERNINYNLGFRYAPIVIKEHKIALYASAFWRNGYDKIAPQAVDSVIVGRENDANIETTKFINIGRTQSRGIEAEVTYSYKNRLNVLLNFSRFSTLFKQEVDENGNRHYLYNRQLPNEPFFTVNGSAHYRLDNILQKKSVFNIYYNMGYVAPFSTVWVDSDKWFETPTQFFHDLGGSYRTPKGNIVVSLDLKNFLNAEMYDNFAVQKPGRGIYLKLNYMLDNIKKKH
ncbi:TonB-dependent receptor [Sphingobacterium rhinopitheci]|uniref:TonB-dependent receptor n=1 Tax=Sphingobacterium rhinopitheci TaxID=2781960 RepID=UPI001F5277F7|nr:TonB-dependent receptor plug domain-containing protein [Sphingobacterium rhinopitheci]MCI0920670.1 TonB-dependent receptor [Sphingobacterium rhinopitheci]